MNYNWVSEQILNKTHCEAVEAIVAQARQEALDASYCQGLVPLLPCSHDASNAYFEGEDAHCRLCDAEVRHIVLTRQMRAMRKALKAIAKRKNLAPLVAELTLKELRNAKRE